MAVIHDILTWSQTLPDWQRDALRRLLEKDCTLDATDEQEIYSLFLGNHGFAVPAGLMAKPLNATHIPVQVKAGEVIALKEMKDLNDVNCIPANQVLPFATTGITVIYGGNGSGKSGYARVLKRACRSRDKTESVHPNANDPARATAVPTANIVIEVNGADVSLTWSRDAVSPDRLSAISVFDAKCARAYLTEEQEVAYLPMGLEIMEALANRLIPALSQKLEAAITAVNTNKDAFQQLNGPTQVGALFARLSHETPEDSITKLGTLSAAEKLRLTQLNSALAQVDPAAKSQELSLAVQRFKALGEAVIQPEKWVNENSIAKLKGLDDAVVLTTQLEAAAANALTKGEELLPGTGGPVWKALFEAARKFSTEQAYHGHDFPYTDNAAVCPLCQEVLNDGADRLKRFEKYVKDDVSKKAKEAADALNVAKGKIEAASMSVGMDATLRAEIATHDEALAISIDNWAESIVKRRDWMLASLETHSWLNVPALAPCPRSSIRSLAARQLILARSYMKASDPEAKKMLEAERNELASRQALAQILQPMLDLLQRMKTRKLLEDAKSGLGTTAISRKAKELASSAVSKDLKDALDAELVKLNVTHIRTKLKERNDRGKMLLQLVLDMPTAKKLDEILSEGEQRSIALASFFAELSLANHTCGIVFDDPVSSLDHWKRRDVARRLVEEARKRQVIVFTHDTSFLGQLSDEIEAAGIPSNSSHLQWLNSTPGNVMSGLPWDHQGYKERIDKLEKTQTKLAKAWPAYPGEEDIRNMRSAYDGLRATLERVIQDVVFNGAVKRYRDWIRVDALEEVVGFDQREYEMIDKLHSRSSDVVSAHDPSSAKAAPVPTPAELANDIASLKALVEATMNRRKLIKAAKAAKAKA
ncbi:MAG: AAA family ATPase [Flavobacteriales bacterium]|nr:AAA family ATPase [Flavobacteriales bacterium]